MKELHNEIIVVNLLPPEILFRIAELACHTSKSPSDQAVIMTQVCRYWRLVIGSHPLVWTDVTVKSVTPLSRVTTALRNSRGLPLRLDLQIHVGEDKGLKFPGRGDAHRGHFRFADFRPPPEPFAILSVLEPYHKQIQGLQIQFLYDGQKYDGSAEQFIRNPFFRCSFDVLDSLSLSFADACSPLQRRVAYPSPSTIEGHFPRLRSLTLSGITSVLHPGLQCPAIESLSIDFPDYPTYGNTGVEGRALAFLKQHPALISLTIKEQRVDEPVKFCRLKSVTLLEEGFDTTIKNGVYPTSLTVMTSLTIQATDLVTIAASDKDGNSITCSARHPAHIATTWGAFLWFARNGVEDLHLDLSNDTPSLYAVLSVLSAVKTVHMAWANDRMERVVETVAGYLSYWRRGWHRKIQIRRWVKDEEDPWTAASRDDAFKLYASRWDWECV